MIQSMTGFGMHTIQFPTKKITIEIKSLNSKNLDLNTRIPSAYKEKELELRKVIASSLERGKVDFSLYIESTTNQGSSQVNEAVVKHYMEQLRAITDGDNIKLMEMALRLPDALKTEKEDIDVLEFITIQDGLKLALVKINTFRTEEGAVLENDFLKRIETLTKLLEEIRQIDQERKIAMRERLNKALTDLKADIDENRFEQELIYYLEKYDITEEKVRLDNHLNYFTIALESPDSNGKKLGFICQEIGREINTIGSKSNYAPMQQLVVQMKEELEKIKEQMLNVL